MRSRLWFVVAGALAMAGLVAAALYLAPRMAAIDQGTVRVVVPGSDVVALDKAGHYAIFHEPRSLVDGRYYASDSVDGLRVTLVAEASGAPIALTEPKVSSSYQLSSHVGVSFLDFDIAQPGRYRLSAALANGAAEPKLVLAISQGLIGGVFQLVFRAFGMVSIGLVPAAILMVIVVLRRDKDRRERREQGG